MECRKCHYDNPVNAKDCLRCGTSLIPPVPRKSDEKPPKIPKDKGQTITVWFVCLSVAGLMVVMFVSLLAASGIFSYVHQTHLVVTTDSSEAIASGSPEIDGSWQEEPGDDGTYDYNSGNYTIAFDDYIDLDNQLIQFPDSTISIGLPEGDITGFYYDNNTKELEIEIINNDVVINVRSMIVSSKPFTKSEEEEIFEPQYSYYRIEGSENQYFYSQNKDNVLSASVVDREQKRITTVEVRDVNYLDFHENPEVMKNCYRTLNEEILDRSSIAQQPDV